MKNDLICFSHLRWHFVYQRPQHLMSRAARSGRVFYFEEPVFTAFPDKLRIQSDPLNGVMVVTPELDNSEASDQTPEMNFTNRLKMLVNELIRRYDIKDYVAWYYAPMALSFSEQLEPSAIVYDCMDELSAFKFASFTSALSILFLHESKIDTKIKVHAIKDLRDFIL